MEDDEMGWIDLNDKYPPQGLQVLLEVSGRFAAGYSLIADHSYYIGTWIVPSGKKEGHWIIYDSCDEENVHIVCPEVHAWMPLPKHFQPQETFGEPEDDLMEHAMFEDEPEWLYKGDCVYEQMTLEDFLKEGTVK
jgi:hypothetical protein